MAKQNKQDDSIQLIAQNKRARHDYANWYIGGHSLGGACFQRVKTRSFGFSLLCNPAIIEA